MRKLQLMGKDILITCCRRIDEEGFARACDFVERGENEVLNIEKSSVILFHDPKGNSIVIERLNTDTFTLHVQYEINCKNVFQIN